MRLKVEFKPGACAVVAAGVARAASIYGASSDDIAYLRFSKASLVVGFAGSGDRVECWLKFPFETAFHENAICESVREDMIDMTVLVGNFVATLKHAARAKSVTLRLSRSPTLEELLVFELRFTAGEGKLVVIQNMPVSIVIDPGSVKEEPRLPDPTCKFELIGLSRLKEVVEKMKGFKISTCQVTLTDDSELVVSGNLDGMSVEATFADVPVLQGGSASASFPVNKLGLLVTHFSALPSSGCTSAYSLTISIYASSHRSSPP